MRKIILIGAGGHAKSCVEAINSQKNLKFHFWSIKYKRYKFI